ncbi:BNR repeat protein [Fulvivirga imtechensis AK7]|uniref:BNR repeat protein n=1 Tax=Fulvivirga imtechensis AK7 TaxID=1237149 RepID=L8JTK9_9BACT|nr:sialidase family protein [Fulvivirga imtechensis]ELR71578.1 BNR repeat protein [Fulvivirga imtechensis AK7]
MKYLIIIFFCIITACSDAEKTSSPVLKHIPVKTAGSSAEPFLCTGPDGKVYLSWIEQKQDTNYLRFSTFNNDQWSEPQTIASGTDWFVNWADYPTLSADSRGNIVAHFLAMSGEGTYSYDVYLTHSNDNGKNWNAPYILHDDGKEAEHGFASIMPYGENFFITWLDGRNAADQTQHTGSGSEGHNMEHHGAMTIRAAVIDPAGGKLNEWELDDRVCDCCQTTTAITANGPVVIYRDRSEEEIRDMSIVRLMDDSTWTAPQPVHNDGWKIAGCPVNGPRAASLGNNMAVAWFSAPEGNAQVKIAFSQDGGASFTDPIRIDSAKTVGRVDVVMLNESTAVVSYMEGADIKVVKVSQNGTKSKAVLVSSSSEARASGFPQMTKSGDHLIFAWTDNDKKEIKTAVLSKI